MIIVSKIISTTIKQGRRLVKLLGFGTRDIREVEQVLPFGIDSNPPKGYKCIYADTADKKERVFLGLINEDVIAEIGETRIFSSNQNKEEQGYILLKNNGDFEFNGTGDFLVRYSKLEEAFNDLQSKWNAFATAYTPGSPSTLGTPATASQSTADISESKINNFKTK